MHSRNFFENKIFGKEIIKKPLKSQLNFFISSQSLFMDFMDKVMKNTMCLELATSPSMGCKTCLEKFLF